MNAMLSYVKWKGIKDVKSLQNFFIINLIYLLMNIFILLHYKSKLLQSKKYLEVTGVGGHAVSFSSQSGSVTCPLCMVMVMVIMVVLTNFS